ncbi:hypothetical protein Asp14428_55200 [Actinoplanes sp. NBRC 14428]|nr:hypothetical protein Asp14428_55200 [Actinoplanes sp. NBRC 14428]
MISMCSASQPSSRAATLAIRRAKHFLPSSELPPYPEPNDQISRVSGKCEMYLVSLQGQATSSCPGSSGAPTECRAGTKSASAPIASSTFVPILVMILMDVTTYALSVSSTPNIGFGASSGPMQNGTTYMVRPRMQPRYSCVMVAFISAGAIQLLVGPASAGSAEQMKVRSSTRATSPGSVRAQNEFGRRAGSRRTSEPASTSVSVSRVHSSSDPSHQTIRSGVVSAATSSTQLSRRAWEVGGTDM